MSLDLIQRLHEARTDFWAHTRVDRLLEAINAIMALKLERGNLADTLAAKDTALAEVRAELEAATARYRTAEADLELWQLQADNLKAALARARKALESIAEVDDDGFTSDGHERATDIASRSLGPLLDEEVGR